MSKPAQIEGAARAGTTSRRRQRRFSSVLRDLAREPGDYVSVAQLAEVFANRAFGALMLLFAVPNLIPSPPPFNASAILGVPLIVITFQMAMGRNVPWLPGFISKRSVPRPMLRRVVDRTLPYIRRAERLLSPRLEWLFGPLGIRIMGVVSLLLSIILFLPIPLGNLPPALTLVVFALALLQRDGVAAIIGYLGALVSVIIVALVAGAVWLMAKAAIHFVVRELNL
jgi:hypothetical protein